ncbi:MAG: FAD-dependent oxidoreductase [Lentisphaeria bacterium]|nr:FAD-dependent oxidoreductase [Lentisphaeria bacterium]
MFIECEQFDDLGGWTLETQCVAAMGSPYLMAHGLGLPVADATTSVTLTKGIWHVWARTRDWTAVWKRGTPAGRFQICIDGQPLSAVLGTNGVDWAWQKAGSITLNNGTHTLALHDLTGFNGRCDAIFFTQDASFQPPNGADALAAFRRTECGVTVVDDSVEYDLIVVGGGYAGVCTALAARASGVKTLLIQDRGVLGGCGSSEIRVWTGGLTNLGAYPELGNVSAIISPIAGQPGQAKLAELFEDERKARRFTEGKDLLLNEQMIGVERDGRVVKAIITKALRTGRETRRRAKLFADCTGDGTLCQWCGCEMMVGREASSRFGETLAPEQADRQVMGHSVLWEPRDCGKPVSFPDIDWGIEFNDQNGLKRFNCCWDWETGQYRDQVRDIEYIRDYGLMTVLGNWSWLKNCSPYKEQLANQELMWASALGGKRESYRVVGDYVITQRDIEERIPHEDGTAPITWSIDLHYPDPVNEAVFGEAFQSCAYHRGIVKPYEIPYRCLVARDMDNVFLGGRIISASHVAFSCIRVMRTLGMLGEVVGMAAAVCKTAKCNPHDIYTSHLEELKARMRRGIRLLPHAYMPGTEEWYHFMRPIGSVGNSDENIRINVGKDGSEPKMDDSLRETIKKLGLKHKYFKEK